MTQATCRCGRPIHDTAYVCQVCQNDLRRDLAELEHFVGEATTTVARLDHVRRYGQPPAEEGDDGWHKGEAALKPTPLLLDPHRAARYDKAVNDLVTWARHIGEERGRDIEPKRYYELTCDHGLCARVHAGLALGVTCALRLRDDQITTLASWLSTNLNWLAHRPEALDAFAEITHALTEIEKVIDTAAGKILYGWCGCGLDLLGHRDAKTVRCDGCGTTYDADPARADLLEQARHRHVTAAQAADLIAGWVDPKADRRKVRDLVWRWAQRGLIEPAEDGLYPLGPILDRWSKALAARVA